MFFNLSGISPYTRARVGPFTRVGPLIDAMIYRIMSLKSGPYHVVLVAHVVKVGSCRSENRRRGCGAEHVVMNNNLLCCQRL